MIGIIDYGVGNLGSILNMYRKLMIPAATVASAPEMCAASRLILPGVGAFDHCVARLGESGLREPLLEIAAAGRIPILGICVGMQMLAEGSDEGSLAGLGLVPGRARRFDAAALGLKVPHMGWSTVRWVAASPLVAGLEQDSRFYFVHSYHVACADPADILGVATYGLEFTCAIRRNNLHGVQFHPEKSHRFGLRLLRNFADL